MAELLEVVFENVPDSKLVEIVLRLFSDCFKIGLMSEWSANEKGSKGCFLVPSKGCSSIVKFHNATCFNQPFSAAVMRVSKFNGAIDLDFTVNEDEVSSLERGFFFQNLHKATNKIASENNVGAWYAGMEPAIDADTRYFTGNEVGPLAFGE